MSEVPQVRTQAGRGSYVPIRLETLRTDTVPGFDLYIKNGDRWLLYRRADLPFTEEHRQALLKRSVPTLFFAAADEEHFHRYLELNIRSIIHDDKIPETAKATIVYNTATYLVQDVLANRARSEDIKRSREFVEATVEFILRGPEAFRGLIEVMSFDYYLYTHSVNVCTLSLALASQLGTEESDHLASLGTGALLHDIGKVKIPEWILQKPAGLTEDEMAVVRGHPAWGLELLKESGVEDELICLPVLQHHERENGAGYPYGLEGSEIHRYSQIVAIADAFDAMTTRRVYRGALGAFPALQEMFDEEGAFAPELLQRFAMILGPCRR